MKEVGKVVKIKGENIAVRLERKTACKNCNMCGFGKEDMYVDITTENAVGAKIGDSVEMQMESSTVLFSAWIVYILPLIFAGLGYLVAYLLHQSEIVHFWGLIAGVAVGFLAVAIVDKKVKKTKFNPVCTRIVEDEQ